MRRKWVSALDVSNKITCNLTSFFQTLITLALYWFSMDQLWCWIDAGFHQPFGQSWKKRFFRISGADVNYLVKMVCHVFARLCSYLSRIKSVAANSLWSRTRASALWMAAAFLVRTPPHPAVSHCPINRILQNSPMCRGKGSQEHFTCLSRTLRISGNLSTLSSIIFALSTQTKNRNNKYFSLIWSHAVCLRHFCLYHIRMWFLPPPH